MMNGYSLVRLQPKQVLKAGDEMTGNLVMNNSDINFSTDNKGIQQNGTTYLRNNGTNTVLSSINNTMYFG